MMCEVAANIEGTKAAPTRDLEDILDNAAFDLDPYSAVLSLESSRRILTACFFGKKTRFLLKCLSGILPNLREGYRL